MQLDHNGQKERLHFEMIQDLQDDAKEDQVQDRQSQKFDLLDGLILFRDMVVKKEPFELLIRVPSSSSLLVSSLVVIISPCVGVVVDCGW